MTQAGGLDWRGRLGPLVARERPDAVLVSIGSNDGRDIAAGGAPLRFGTPAWDAEYGRRTCAFAMDATSGGAAVVWMGHPPPWRGDGNARMARIAPSSVDARKP